MARDIILGNNVIQMFQAGGELRETCQCDAECMVRFQKKIGIARLLGKAQALLCQFARDLVIRACGVKHPQSPEYWEKLRCLAYLLTQFARASVYFSNFR